MFKLDPADKDRLSRSAALIADPLPYGHELYDYVFVGAKARRDGNVITFDINNKTPVIASPEVQAPLRDQLGIATPSFRDMIQGTADPRLTGISCGAYLWFNGITDEPKIAMVKRKTHPNDDPALGFVAAPGQYICPSGRADNLPSRVCLAEAAQEVITLLKQPDGSFTPLQYMFNGIAAMDIDEMQQRLTKAREVEARINIPADQRLPEKLNAPIPFNVRDRAADKERCVTFVTRLNGRTVDEVSAMPYFQGPWRTVHMHRPMEIDIPAGASVRLYNGEAPGRPVQLMNGQDMLNENARHATELTTNPKALGGVFPFVVDVCVNGYQDDVPAFRGPAGYVEGSYADVQRRITAARGAAKP